MDTPVAYGLEDGVATIALDDGKANALSLRMLGAIDAALDRALADGAVVVLTGREGMFSAGFDLGTLREGGPGAVEMLSAGFALAERLLSFPAPVVVACSGHAIAMASFLLLTGDYRIGADGPYRVTANEVAIGLTMPFAAIEICRHRLTPSHFNRAVITAEVFSPHEAIAAGFLDAVVDRSSFGDAVTEAAHRLAGLDRRAYVETKQRVRAAAIEALQAGIAADGLGR